MIGKADSRPFLRSIISRVSLGVDQGLYGTALGDSQAHLHLFPVTYLRQLQPQRGRSFYVCYHGLSVNNYALLWVDKSYTSLSVVNDIIACISALFISALSLAHLFHMTPYYLSATVNGSLDKLNSTWYSTWYHQKYHNFDHCKTKTIYIGDQTYVFFLSCIPKQLSKAHKASTKPHWIYKLSGTFPYCVHNAWLTTSLVQALFKKVPWNHWLTLWFISFCRAHEINVPKL